MNLRRAATTCRPIALAVGILAASTVPRAQQPAAEPPPLLAHLAGRWVLSGTIEAKPATHDVEADFVLNRGYLRLHEVSREKDASGAPAYEAIVFISVDPKSGEYRVLWLDSTSNAGLSNDGVGRARPDGNRIPFVFRTSGGEVFHNTFVYTPGQDSWQWIMDGESGGKLEPFARLTLTRAKQAGS